VSGWAVKNSLIPTLRNTHRCVVALKDKPRIETLGTLSLERPFKVPVNLRDEQKIRLLGAHRLNYARPECVHPQPDVRTWFPTILRACSCPGYTGPSSSV